MGIGAMSAQQGSMGAGINLGYGSEIKSMEIGAKFQYGITNNIRGEVAWDYFLEKDYVSMWDLNITGHYLFNVAEKINVYPLAGLHYAKVKVDFGEFGSASDGEIGFHLGGGAEYQITPNIKADIEAKYQFSSTDQAVISVGLVYQF